VNLTLKDELSFINDIDLRRILRDRLEELERVFSVNAHYSTVFLAISSIEGVFKHIADIFKTEIKSSSKYPLIRSSQHAPKKKPFDKLTIDDLYVLLTEQDILRKVDNFEHVHELLRNYRNFVHPREHIRKGWRLDLGQAQMALGLLNATIDELARRIFIGKSIFVKVAGKPDYESSTNTLSLPRTYDSPLQSFVVLNRDVVDTLLLDFDLELPSGSVFNFVFNYRDDGNFKMFRLDSRKPEYNCLLQCAQKYHWRFTHSVFPQTTTDASIKLGIKIDLPNKIFTIIGNGITYQLKDRAMNNVDLFDQIEPGMKVGFFSEEGIARLSHIRLQI
jgi:hypothetical protein